MSTATKSAKSLENRTTRLTSRGPRVKAWCKELNAKRRQLKKSRPGTPAFCQLARRVTQLAGLTIGYTSYSDIQGEVVTALNPDYYGKCMELGRLCDDRVSCYPTWNAWTDDTSVGGVYVTIHVQGGFLKCSADELPGELAKMLRREASALNAMADKIEK
jgi:hypothetical protein